MISNCLRLAAWNECNLLRVRGDRKMQEGCSCMRPYSPERALGSVTTDEGCGYRPGQLLPVFAFWPRIAARACGLGETVAWKPWLICLVVLVTKKAFPERQALTASRQHVLPIALVLP